MADEATEELSEFFDYMWGTESPTGRPVFVYLPVKWEGFQDPEKNPVGWKKFMFVWPKQKAGVIKHVLKHNALGGDVYYSPALYNVGNPQKQNVMGSHFLWADFDGNAPASWEGLSVPEPTLIVQSSLPGHEHAYWRLDSFLEDIELLEERNASIAYALQADTSGWDADQVLRPPQTMNYKRTEPVTIKSWDR
jgi:hypothetical protein